MAKLTIVVEFDREPSLLGMQEVKSAVQALKEAIKHLGRVTRADFSKAGQ